MKLIAVWRFFRRKRKKSYKYSWHIMNICAVEWSSMHSRPDSMSQSRPIQMSVFSRPFFRRCCFWLCVFSSGNQSVWKFCQRSRRCRRFRQCSSFRWMHQITSNGVRSIDDAMMCASSVIYWMWNQIQSKNCVKRRKTKE